MILDSFKLHTVIIQLQYPNAYELWDRAGAIGRRLSTIWSDLELIEGTPQQQGFRARDVHIQTALRQSTITLTGANPLDPQKIQQAKETFEVWRETLILSEIKRISTRATYAKEFPSMKEANAEIFALNLARWPTAKVFDQPIEADLNGLELSYRFEDENSFSFLRVKAEQIKFEAELNPEFVDESRIEKSKHRMIIDFDRGLLGSVSAEKFRMDDWIKGYQHILRRDIEKITKA